MNTEYKKSLIISSALIFAILWFPIYMLPPSKSPQLMPHFDKVIHFTLFMFWGFYNSKSFKKTKFLFLTAFFIAVTTELGQILIPKRNFEGLDILADCFGLVPSVILNELQKRTNKN